MNTLFSPRRSRIVRTMLQYRGKSGNSKLRIVFTRNVHGKILFIDLFIYSLNENGRETKL